MQLFEDLNFAPGQPRPLRIETPLGTIESCAIINGERLEIADACFFDLASGAWSARWELRCGVAQVVATGCVHTGESHASVVDLQSFVWRFVATSGVRSLTFEARRAHDFGPSEGGVNSGQWLEAQTWDDGRIEVSLGTEGDDALFERSQRGDWLPRRYAQQEPPGVEDLQLTRYLGDDGLAIDFGAASPGERFGAHFAVAWAAYDVESVATWQAVNSSATNILLGARKNPLS